MSLSLRRPALPRSPAGAGSYPILSLLLAVCLFSTAAVIVKALGGALPLSQVILCRNLFALPLLLPLLLSQGGIGALRTSRPLSHALRVFFGLVGMIGPFYAYSRLPLLTVTALNFTMPFFLAALSVPLLGEKVGPRRIAAIVIGFCGVLVMLRPGGSSGADPFAAMMVLIGALAWALAMISIRRMGAAGESAATIVLWFAIGSALASAVFAIPQWQPPSTEQWLLLVGLGVVSSIAQIFMTSAYRRAESTLLAPFEYSAILWTTLFGAMLWGEYPGQWDMVGIAILVGCGLFIWYREVRVAGRLVKPPGLRH